MAFSEVLSDISNHGKYSLSLYDMGRYMRLDAAAQRALNVMKTKFDANDNFSLYGLMSRARTSMGKRLLKASTHTCPHTRTHAHTILNPKANSLNPTLCVLTFGAIGTSMSFVSQAALQHNLQDTNVQSILWQAA